MAETRDFRLPDLGEGLTEAEIVSWLVKEGEEVTLNQPLVEVETEKALVEIPSPFAGVVSKLHGDVGEKVQVGAALVSFETTGDAPQTGRREVLVGYGPEEEGTKRRRRKPIGRRGKEEAAEPEQADDEPEQAQADDEPEQAQADDAAPEQAEAAEEAAPPPAAKEQPAAKTQQPAAAAPQPPGAKALATPPVRKLARELGVEIDTIGGSGPGGRVTREDVEAAAKGGAAPAAPAAATPAAATLRAVPSGSEERIPVRAIRRTIAERMVKSKFTIPHVTEWLQVDATELMSLRADLASAPEAEGGKMSPLPIIVKALIAALRRHPMINSAWDDNGPEIVVKHFYNIGIATDTERGLLVPVVRGADQLSVFDLAREIGRLAAAARDGSIGPADLSGSTITVTNVGSFGMDSGTPVINYPEAAILAPGMIAKRPWVVDGEIAVRDVMTIALTFDHRVIDGAEAGRFLRYLSDLIEKPARLFGVL